MEISVLIYNVAGLPWPLARGKTSRDTDDQGKRIPIDGKRVSVILIRVEAIFDEPQEGIMPSDHNGLLVHYRLSWPITEK